MRDEQYMDFAIELAKKGVGRVNPNPLVGAVIVKNSRIIGQGYHERYGSFHAERNAFLSLTMPAEGATLYVTLEPCCHYGKQPPCTDKIIEEGIKKVVIGSFDPNPLVCGKGIQELRNHGIEVVTGVRKEACDHLNTVFFHYIKEKTPYVVLKYAMTMDGKIATVSGESRWITGEQAREHVHLTRNCLSGIMVGVGTILADDPILTCRIPSGRNPTRIICDTKLRTPIDSVVVRTAKEVPTMVATAITAENEHKPYIEAGCEVLMIQKSGKHIDLRVLMKELGKRNIDGILLEGGATLASSALEQGIVQRVQTYLAPKIFTGDMAKTPVGGAGIAKIQDCIRLKNMTVQELGEDYLIESEVDVSCLPES